MSTTATLPVKAGPVTGAELRLSRLMPDPRTWLVSFVSAAIWISSSGSLNALLSGCIALITVFAIRRPASQEPHVSIWTLISWGFVAGAITIVLYALFGPKDGGAITEVAGVRVAQSALLLGLVMATKLIALLLLSTVLLCYASPLELASGAARLCAPLRHVGIPVSNVYYLAFFLTRMIPSLIQESRMIVLAQRSRGIVLRKWSSYPALALPLFASALRRSDGMALLLASRGFDSTRIPARVQRLRLGMIDYLAIVMLGLGWSVWIYLHIW